MKKQYFFSIVILIALFGGGSLVYGYLNKDTDKKSAVKPISNDKINWYTLQEAMQANKENKKNFIIDVYTDWCYWCKVMDKQTFTNPQVIEYVNKNFYPVKFDAEQKEAITFMGKEHTFMQAGKRGVNTLAVQLLKGRLSYPSIVYLDGDLNHLLVSPGFKKPQQMLQEMERVVQKSTTLGMLTE